MIMRHARGRGCRLQVVDILLKRLLAAVFDRADTNDRYDRHNGAAQHRFLEILCIIFGEGGDLLLEQHELLVGPGLEPFKALLDVGEEAGL
jgi:hypothetical protein